MDKKEARDILIGRLVRVDEPFWAAAPSGVKFPLNGIRDGADDAYLFGVTHLTRCYQTEGIEPAIAFAAVENALYSMGRPIRLNSAPAEKAALYAPHWIAPVLLSVEQHEDGLQLTAYTGQSLLIGKLRCRIAMWILEQRLPEGITPPGEYNPPKKATKEKQPKERPAEKESSLDTSTRESQRKKAAPKRLKKKTTQKRLKK